VAAAIHSFPTRALYACAAIAVSIGTAAAAQNAGQTGPANKQGSASALRLPSNPQLFGTAMPSVVKATAIVNGEVITQTDVDQRLALLAISSGGKLPTDQIDQLRQQVLRNLIDETLQIQAAKAAEIEVTDKDIDRTLQRVATGVKMNPDQLAQYLKANGSSIKSMRRQIHGEIAWRRLQQAKIENSVSVGDDEVKAVLSRLNASKGTEEYKVGEIFLAATRDTMPQAIANANKILEQLKAGGSFVGYARQFSEASTAAVSITFPQGTSRQQAEARVAQFAQAARNVGGCGGADRIATEFNGELVQSDQVNLRELPPALQEIMLPMQVGQATRPFGSIEEGVRILVICGRDEVDPSAPTFDQVVNQLTEERVNLRARRFLRDLRRDAVIEFR
jgi:peptidyl-prolyl cis-trans isomerase SurA